MLEARARERLLRSPAGRAGALAVAALVTFCVLGPLLAHQDPNHSDFAGAVTATGMPVGPGAAHLLGADRLYRDVLARLAAAGRLSLGIALGATALATSIGTALGVTAGLSAAGGAARRWAWLDAAVMRSIDVLLAFPFLLLVMALGASLDRASGVTILVTLGLTSWLGVARIVRAKTLQVRVLDFVEASRALGQPLPGIVRRHVLPHVAGPVVVTSTMLVAQMIVADSVLSYLGVGIAPPTATWGRMLFEGQDYYAVAPWLVAAPGAAIVLAVWGFNMLGEGLRDALDPR